MMKRELNDIEYFQWIFGQPYNIVMAVRFRGELLPDRLRNALDKAQQRHPLLRVTTILDGQGRPWFTSEGVGKIPMEVLTREDDEHALRIVKQELATKFSMDIPQVQSLPLLHVTLLVGVAPSTAWNDIIFCTQHTIADGMSMIFLVRDLIQFMDNPDEPVVVLDALASDADLFPPNVRRKMPKTMRRFNLSSWILKVRHRLKFGKSQKPPKLTDGEPLLDTSEPAPPEQSFKLYSWRLPPAQTSELLIRCKQERVSVHAAICTAFLQNFPAINSPVNMRARFARPVGESFGFLASSTIISMKYNSKEGFWNNARKFHRKLLSQLRDSTIFSIYRIFSKIVPRAKIQEMGSIYAELMGFRQPFTITNIGSLDNRGIPLTTGNLNIEEFFGGVSGIGIVLLVFTINQTMHFHLHYSEPETTDAEVRSWAQDAMNFLGAASNQ